METGGLHASGVAIGEVDLKTIPAGDAARWMAYDRIMTGESPATPFDARRFSLNGLPEFITLRLFVARDADGSVVGDGRAVFSRTANNQQICQAHVGVRPDRRRRGIGTSLLRSIVDAAEADRRSVLIGWSFDRVPAGAEFARRIGAEAAAHQQVNRLLLRGLDRTLVRTWIAEGPRRAKDYVMDRVDGPYPDAMVEEIVDLRSIMNETPRGAFQMEAPVLTVAQVRNLESVLLTPGAERWTLLARHRPTGELVGFTEMGVLPMQPTVAQQWGTAVRPAHRGHALGKWLKAAMLERVLAERPQVEEVRTGNAATNAAMLAINAELGFSLYMSAIGWQAPIRQVREHLAAARA